MKVIVVGANGKIGKQVVDLLSKHEEHSVKALVRKQEQAAEFRNRGIEAVLVDLEGSVSAIAAAAEGFEAIVFTAGSGGATGYDKTLLIDLDGAVKTMEAAQQAGVRRFIMVSAFQANQRENWSDSIKPYYVAKHYADRILESSDLNYTIIRPGGLLDEPGTGKVQIADPLLRGSVPREDVAAVIVAALGSPAAQRKAFDLVTGQVPIEQVVAAL